MTTSSAQRLIHQLRTLFSSSGYQPLHERDLAKQLRLPSGGRGVLRAILHDMEEQNMAARFKGGRWGAPAGSSEGLEGRFQVRPSGTCWFIADDPQQEPLKINDDQTNGALNGDRILALPLRYDGSRLFPGQKGTAKKARVQKVIQRKRQQVVGIVYTTPHYAYIVPRDPLLRMNIKLSDPPKKMKPYTGHLISARLTDDAPAAGQPLTAAFVEDFGNPEDAANDIPALLADHDFSEAFAPAIQKAARNIPAGRRPQEPKEVNRRDLRKELIITIDPQDAHDYDDAVSIKPLPDGGWELGVHIADVAAFIPADSVLDKEARRRGNSTYLVDRVIRMLPEDLTVRVCSLQPQEDHLTHSVVMRFNKQAAVTGAQTFRSIIRSKACLSYEQVQTYFDSGRLPGVAADIRAALDQLRVLARKIRAKRFRHGALDFSLPEVHCELDANGQPVGFTKRGAVEAYHLIEECMLAANQVVAQKVFDSKRPGIYRVHDAPSDEQWTRMAAELRALGINQAPHNAQEINHIARDVLGKPEQYMVTLTLLRNMKRAVYEAESRPHFGLGFTHYAHFTSPIRRYPDLILHRLLNAIETKNATPYSHDDLARLAIHCSETERESADLEGQSLQIKRIRYYAALLARGQNGPFEGTIISLNPKGLIVELKESLQQGLLPYHALGRERYYVSEDGFSASARKGSPYRLGQEIRVRLASVNEPLKRVDFFPDEQPGGGQMRHQKKSASSRANAVDKKRKSIKDSKQSDPKRAPHKRR